MIKKKLLFFKYCRFHHYDLSFSIFNIPVYRKYDRNGFPQVEVLGMRWKISAARRVKRAAKDVRNQFHHRFSKAIVLSNHSGETTLLLAKIAEQLRKQSDTLLIVTRFYHIQFMEIYAPNVPFYFCPELVTVHMDPKVKRSYEFYGLTVHVPGTLDYFAKLEQKIRTEPMDLIPNFYDRFMTTFLPHLGFKQDTVPTKPVISEIAQKSFEDRLENLDFNGKIVILSPESVSNERISPEFWQKLSKVLHGMGYTCVFNVMMMCPEARYGHILPTNYTEALLLAQKADCIIGLRSGFLDVVSPVARKMIVLYTAFTERSKILPSVKAERVKVAFSLKNLPCAPKELDEIVLPNANLDEKNIDDLIDKVKLILK